MSVSEAIGVYKIVLERKQLRKKGQGQNSGEDSAHGRGTKEASHKRVPGASESYFCPGAGQVHWPSGNSLKLLLNFTLNLATI